MLQPGPVQIALTPRSEILAPAAVADQHNDTQRRIPLCPSSTAPGRAFWHDDVTITAIILHVPLELQAPLRLEQIGSGGRGEGTKDEAEIK